MKNHKILISTIIGDNYEMALVETEKDYVISLDYHRETGQWEQGIYYPKFCCVIDAAIDDYSKKVAEMSHTIM